MNKNEFLKELENRIRVLEKTEIKDILAEYSQHIDMKMNSGLSETDAIKDFGNIEDLAAEILEAYHVNPEYEAEGAPEIIEPAKEPRKKAVALSAAFAAVLTAVKRAGKAVISAVKWLWKHFIGFFIAIGALIKKVFSRKKKPVENNDSEEFELIEAAESGKKLKKERRKGRGKKMASGLLFVCLAVVVVLCLIPVTFAAVASVFGLGVSAVLFVQGYPIIGILIGCLGLSMMSVSLWLILASLLSRKNKDKKNEEEFDEAELEEAVNI